MNKLTRFLVLLCLVLMTACGPIIGRFGDPASPKTKLTVGMPQLRGTNLTGGEVDYGAANTDSPTSGQDYLFVSHQDIDYLAAKGVRFVRLNMSWECAQPVLNGPLASTGNGGVYVSTLVDRVNYLTSKDIHVLVEPHGASDKNFVRYKGNLVGSAAVPNSAFADFWGRMATQFKGNPKVMYGLSNEPHDMSTMQWYAGAQAAITAIRAAGATTPIFVAGNGWSQPGTWNSTSIDTAATKVSNATGWSTLVDPGKNLVVSVHTYFDAGGGGGADDIAGPDIIQTRLQPVVDWARAKGLKVHLSELGANSATAGSQAAVTNALKYMDANADVVLGWSWWSYGPPAWWSGYRFTLDPTSNYTVDNPKMAWLQPFFVASVQPTPGTPVPPPSPVPNPIAFTKNAKGTIVVNGVTSWIFVPQGYDSTHKTPTKLFVWLHGCGGQSQYDADMVSWMPNQDWISLAVGGRETTCWSSYASDGAMILAAIADMKTHFNIDPKRVILGGYSSGGDIGYELGFKNANLFAGMIFENTGPSSAALTASTTAAWKLNIAHLAHTGDTTYPIAAARANSATLKSRGFPATLIEKAGGHYDNDNGQTGTQYDLRTFLLPYIDAGWVSGAVVTPPPPPACAYDYSAWSACASSGTQTRTSTSSPAGCVGTPTLSQACVYVPPACVYVYTDWSVCASNGTQTRAAAISSASPCTGSPVTTQTCTYVPPEPIKPLVVSAVKTYDWGSGYCKQYYFKNPNAVPVSWKTMTIYLNDGKLRGTAGVWGATFPNPTATGKVVVTPIPGRSTIAAGQNTQTVGFCADYGPTKYVGTSGGLTY